MPYIPQDRRDLLDDFLNKLVRELRLAPDEDLPGRLTYTITRLLWGLCPPRKCTFRQASWNLGALEAAKLEFYRRVVAPYEDEAIKRNGDLP